MTLSADRPAFSALLFDLDGTLLDTLQDLADSANRALQDLGCPAHPTDSYRIFVGDGVGKLMERALPEDHRDSATIAEAVQAMRNCYKDHWADATRPYPGIVEMLQSLQHAGKTLVVLSNKPHDFTCLCVKRFFPEIAFTIIQGVDNNTPPKPDPAGALRIAKELQIPPARWLYLGDTNTDMKTAVGAGMYAVGVKWGFREEKELREAGAKSIVTQAEEVALLAEGNQKSKGKN